MILLDTNILVHAVDTVAASHAPCHAVVGRAMSGRLDAVIVPQVLMEFYAVVTSRRRVLAPLSPSDGALQVADWRRTIAVRYPTAACLDEWSTLVGELRRAGQNVHDMFLIAQMRSHGIGDICTANVGDFAGVTGIIAHRPETVTRAGRRFRAQSDWRHGADLGRRSASSNPAPNTAEKALLRAVLAP